MSRSKTCPKCQASMTEGFVVDNVYGGQSVSGWVEGTPKRSFWFGLELGGKTPFEISTWRCGNCGFLEDYAKAAAKWLGGRYRQRRCFKANARPEPLLR